MGGTLHNGVLNYLATAIPDGKGGWSQATPKIPNGWSKHVRQKTATAEAAVPSPNCPSDKPVVHPPGQWNTYDITCRGRIAQVFLNGTTSSYTDNCRVTSGRIGLESEGAPIEFRNIRVKRLDADL